jgi:hypothetical protein
MGEGTLQGKNKEGNYSKKSSKCYSLNVHTVQVQITLVLIITVRLWGQSIRSQF